MRTHARCAYRRVNKSQTKVLAGYRFGYRMNPEGYLADHFQRPISAMTARHPATRRAVVAGNRTTFPSKEMCHAKIHRCSRIDLADCDPDAHPDCKRSARVTGELLVRKQRLLTTSRANERFCSRLNSQDGRLALARRPPATTRLRGGAKMRD